MAKTTYLITGSSRGLGIETARQLLAGDPSVQVIAGARNPATANLLKDLIKEYEGRIEAVKLDVSSAESIEAAVKEIKAHPFAKDGIDVLWNNAGIIEGHTSILQSKFSDLETTMATNVYGVVHLTAGVADLLRAGKQKKIIVTSSLLGSLGTSPVLGAVAATYAISKAAVNMYTVKLALELKDEGFTVITFHPGYVKTDINGGADGPAEITPEDSVSQTLAWVLKTTTADNGKYINYTGTELPW